MKYSDEQLIQDIRHIDYKGEIDIVDSVMSRVSFLPQRRSVWNRWGRYVAAACVLLAISTGLYTFLTPVSNDTQISAMFVSAYSYGIDEVNMQNDDVFTSYYGNYSDEE